MNALLKLSVITASLLAAQAGATTITFEDLAEGSALSTQYAGLGLVFTANAFSGNGGPTGDWATNTTMTVTALDLGIVGEPPLVSGKMLHSLGMSTAGYFAEDGDPSFLISFLTPVTSFSADFAGIGADPTAVQILAYNGTTLLGQVQGSCVAVTVPCQETLSFSAPAITSVAVVPGSYNDWVAVDNISFTPTAVPEVGTYAMMAMGMALLGLRRRQPR